MKILGPWRGVKHVSAIEVIEIPEQYMKRSEDEKLQKNHPFAFHNILRGMILADVPVGIRIERANQKTRVFFLTWSKKETDLNPKMDTLITTLKAHLPEFGLKPRHKALDSAISHDSIGVSAYLLGEPQVSDEKEFQIDPLTAAVEVLQTLENGLIQIFAKPMKPKKSAIRNLESDYEAVLQQSQRTVSSTKKSIISREQQESRTIVDAKAVQEAERLRRQLERMRNRHLCEITVVATVWGINQKAAQMQAKRLISILTSTLDPADTEEDFKIVLKKKEKEFRRLIRGIPTGDTTLLTPQEATPYFTLPRCDIGIRTTQRKAFSTAPSVLPEKPPTTPMTAPKSVEISRLGRKRKRRWSEWNQELIVLGYALRNGEPLLYQQVGLIRKMLASHVGVFGNTGYGKTVTSISLVAQAWKCGAIPIILVPDKVEDWRVLRDVIPNLRIFTAGNPDISPLRLNMWSVPSKVSVGKYIGRIGDVYINAIPKDGVIDLHFGDIFNTMYDNCGWSRRGNAKGRSILLTDLYEAVQEVTTHHLKYGDNLRQDFFGALEARVRGMLRDELIVDMYNTPSGLTIPELLRYPTIIEMRDLSPDDQAFLTGILTVGISEYLTANPKETLKHLLVLEEAHHFLKNVGGPTTYAEPTAKQKATDNLVGMLRTTRGKGLGIMFIDQIPSSMVPEAIKLPSNVIVHRLTDEAERILVGKQALCSDAQIDHIGGMGIGEAVVRLMIDDSPRNVQIAPLDYLCGDIRFRKWTDEMVRKVMAPVFKKHPELNETIPLTLEFKALLKGKGPVEPESEARTERVPVVEVDIEVSEIIQSSQFSEQYLSRVASAESGDVGPVVRMLKVVARKFTPPDLNPIPLAERLLLHAAGVFQEPTDVAVLGAILRSLAEAES